MTRYALVIAAALMLLAGCGGSSDQAAPPATNTISAPDAGYTPPTEPAYTPPTESGEYAAPSDVVQALNAKGIACTLDSDPPVQDILGSTTQTCWLPGRDQARINIYYTAEQQADGVRMLKGNNWQVVEGKLWTVSVMQPQNAVKIQQALKS